MLPVSRTKSQGIIAVGALAIVLAGTLFFALNPIRSPGSPNVTCTSFHTSFLVIANGQGYNDSVDRGVPQNYWPILCVHQGDTVTIKVENTGNEPHGFQIAHYYAGGIALAEGQAVTVSFVADQAGSFSIKCNILCSVHPWMLSGILVVR